MPEEKRDGNVWLGSRTDVTSLRDWISISLERRVITDDQMQALAECLSEGLQAISGISLTELQANLDEQRLTPDDTPPADGDMLFRVRLVGIDRWLQPAWGEFGPKETAVEDGSRTGADQSIHRLYALNVLPGRSFLAVQNCHTRPSPE